MEKLKYWKNAAIEPKQTRNEPIDYFINKSGASLEWSQSKRRSKIVVFGPTALGPLYTFCHTKIKLENNFSSKFFQANFSSKFSRKFQVNFIS